MARTFFFTVGRSAFGIGDTPAIFQRNNTAKISLQVSIMCVRCESRSLATCLINFTGKWSSPVDHSYLTSFIFLIIWLDVTSIRLNVKLHWWGRDSTRFKIILNHSKGQPGIVVVIITSFSCMLISFILQGSNILSMHHGCIRVDNFNTTKWCETINILCDQTIEHRVFIDNRFQATH